MKFEIYYRKYKIRKLLVEKIQHTQLDNFVESLVTLFNNLIVFKSEDVSFENNFFYGTSKNNILFSYKNDDTLFIDTYIIGYFMSKYNLKQNYVEDSIMYLFKLKYDKKIIFSVGINLKNISNEKYLNII